MTSTNRDRQLMLSMTRMQSYRQMNRHRPLTMVFMVIWSSFFIVLYIRIVFGTVGSDPVPPGFLNIPANADGIGLALERNRAHAVTVRKSSNANGSDSMKTKTTSVASKGGEGNMRSEIELQELHNTGSENVGNSKVASHDSAIKSDGFESERTEMQREEVDTTADGKNKNDIKNLKVTNSSLIGDAKLHEGIKDNFIPPDKKLNETDKLERMRGRYETMRRRSMSFPKRDRDELAAASLKGFLAFGFWLLICVVIRVSLAFFVRGSRSSSGGSGSFSGRGSIFLRRRNAANVRRQQQQARFSSLVRRLNRQRSENGERPISADSLRVVISQRDFTGNDYDALLRFDEENGAAPTFLSSIGATEAEIGRCPSHVIENERDYLLMRSGGGVVPADGSTTEDGFKSCPICLERYVIGDHVRTIPCFHTFHVVCIDPWLGQKAICPVCKHPAIG